ncbi:MAG: GNAT family N-acetyltransferase [Gammaproteobacteria bacterium]|nr:MAG: GNAT family N-acetyltransferase [Gammaproteobacteria bacterium]
MNNLIITQEDSNSTNQIVDGILQLRHETFIQRLDWDIPSVNGRERDYFDDLQPYHIAVLDQNKSVVNGCWRALPTTGDYMLKSIFPELLQGEAAPSCDDVWEISRFAVRKGSAEKEVGLLGNVTVDLVRSFHDFAIQNDIKAYVTVTTVACERLLRQLGVSLRRMGAASAMQIGKERSVALWIDVNQKLAIQRN